MGALLPGFIDAHHHFAYAALDYGSPDLRLEKGGMIADLQARVQTAVAEKPLGWVYLCGFEPANLAERRAPNADELEECCPGRPLFVQAANGHQEASIAAAWTRWGGGSAPRTLSTAARPLASRSPDR